MRRQVKIFIPTAETGAPDRVTSDRRPCRFCVRVMETRKSGSILEAMEALEVVGEPIANPAHCQVVALCNLVGPSFSSFRHTRRRDSFKGGSGGGGSGCEELSALLDGQPFKSPNPDRIVDIKHNSSQRGVGLTFVLEAAQPAKRSEAAPSTSFHHLLLLHYRLSPLLAGNRSCCSTSQSY